MHSIKLFDKHSLFRMKLQNKRKVRKHHSLPPLPFEQLPPTISDREISKNKRKRYSFDQNRTPALKLDISDEELEQKASHPQEIFEFSKNNILNHAERRAHFFFLSLIAYYNTGLSPIMGKTRLQHGTGRNSSTGANLTQACHSSLFSSFIDETQHTCYSNSQYKIFTSILSGTSLLENLNATVELPGFVNKIDDELENTYQCRTTGIKIIQQVAHGERSPIEGMAAFFDMMEKAFKAMKENRIMKNHRLPFMQQNTADSPRQMKHELLTLIEKGTFNNKWDSEKKEVMSEYIHLYLRLTDAEIAQCKTLNETEKNAFYIKKIILLQKEIFNHPSEASQKNPCEIKNVYKRN